MPLPRFDPCGEQQQNTYSRSDARSAPQLIDERLLLFKLRLKNVDKREEVALSEYVLETNQSAGV